MTKQTAYKVRDLNDRIIDEIFPQVMFAYMILLVLGLMAAIVANVSTIAITAVLLPAVGIGVCFAGIAVGVSALVDMIALTALGR